MATPKGIIGFQGTIGGISFYMRKGKPCARKAGGPSKETVATSKKCKRTRENNAEFKGAVAASKILRIGFNQFIKNFADWNISGRLNGVFRKIIDRSNGIRGERPLEVLPNRDLLIGFNFNKEISFDSLFQAPFSSSVNLGRNEVTLTIPDFNTTKLINAPSGASHFRLVNAIAVISNLVFDPLAKQYLEHDGRNEIMKASGFSDFIPLDDNVGSTVNISASFQGSPDVAGINGVICCIGIEFYQEIASGKYLLNSSNAMKIHNIY